MDILDCKYYKNKSLKDYCTFKIGGEAKHLFEVFSLSALIKACLWCKYHKIRFKVIGLGANLLFSDDGYDGAIIVNRSNNYKFKDDYLIAESGVNMASLINGAYQNALSNLENFAGIPATLGGAIVNNLGAFNSEIGDMIDYVIALDKSTFDVVKLSATELKFAYRDSIFKHKDYIILKAKIKMQSLEKSLIKQRISDAIFKKTISQPVNYASAGSVFKRCEIIPAKAIDDLNLKGFTIGGAQISHKHAGFIVNINNSSSNDVLYIIKHIKTEVLNKYNVNLTEEIEFVN